MTTVQFLSSYENRWTFKIEIPGFPSSPEPVMYMHTCICERYSPWCPQLPSMCNQNFHMQSPSLSSILPVTFSHQLLNTCKGQKKVLFPFLKKGQSKLLLISTPKTEYRTFILDMTHNNVDLIETLSSNTCSSILLFRVCLHFIPACRLSGPSEDRSKEATTFIKITKTTKPCL